MITSGCCGSVDWAAAAEAADELLKSYYKLDIFKALDPLDDADFLVIVQQLSTKLSKITGPLETAAVRTAMNNLDFDLTTATSAQIARYSQAVNLAIRSVPQEALPALVGTMKKDLSKTVRGTKVRSRQKYSWRIDTSLDKQDEAIVNSLSKLRTWVTDEYGKRASMASQGIEQIIGAGVRDGLRADDIAVSLRELGQQVAINQSKNYWRIVAMNAVNRARNYGHIRSMDDAGIEAYVFTAVMDERTTEECRMLDGKRFPVQGALQRFAQLELETQSDSEAAQRVMPFVQRAQVGGVTQLFVQPPGGARTVLGEVVQPGFGQADTRGVYRNVLDPGQIMAAGAAVPPLHHLCRSTLLPDI